MPRLARVDLYNPVGRPWDIQPGEPGNWFMRFNEYIKLSTVRTIEAVYEYEKAKAIKAGKYTMKAVPMLTQWKAIANTWAWADRAAMFDAEQVTLARAEDAHRQQVIAVDDETDRIEQRVRRKQIIDAIYTPVIQYLSNNPLNLSSFKPSEQIALIKLLLQESRAEFDDLPARELASKFASKTNAELIEIITKRIAGTGSSE
jgi:hypothetical protein